MIRTYPKPEPIEPPIYFATELWFAIMMIIGTLFFLAIFGFIMIDGGHLNDCKDMKATQNWIDLCYQVNNTIINLFIVLSSIFSISLIMYFISKRQNFTEVNNQ